jgi:Bacterial Ig-like domain
MKQTSLVFFLIILPFAIIALVFSSGCANIIPPTGGPRDTLPPVLMQASPPLYSLHFNTNRITLVFDEYLELNDARKNLIVSPVPKTDPVALSKLKTVTIQIKDTLEPNTTYSINFGRAIRDINEGNVLKNFTYVFSTGSHIDSLEFSGNVIVASSGKVDSSLIVILHRKLDDSAVAKDRPRYMTRVDTAGNFHFHYLEPGTYAIYALEDGGMRKYTSKSQLFAFSDTPIVVQPNYTPVTLFAFNDTSGSKPAKKTTTVQPKKKEKDKRLMVEVSVDQGQFDILHPFEILFKTPIKYFDSSKVRFTDEKFNDIKGYSYTLDSSYKKVTLHYQWPMDTRFNLIAQKNFAQDTSGNMLLKTDTITFRTKKESDYGTLRIRFYNLNVNRHPILQFLLAGEVKMTRPLRSRDLYEPLMQPGEYQLRILYDENNNGKWDPGQFFGGHRQPEKVVPIKLRLVVRANWDNEKDINL